MRRQGALGRIGDGPRAPQLLWMAEIAPPAILLRSRRDCLFIPRLPPSPNVGLFGASGIVRSTFCLSRTELRWGPLQSFDQIQVSGTSRPGSSQLVAAQGLTCRSVGGKHAAKTGQDFCCRDMEATSLCFPFASLARERGKSFSY